MSTYFLLSLTITEKIVIINFSVDKTETRRGRVIAIILNDDNTDACHVPLRQGLYQERMSVQTRDGHDEVSTVCRYDFVKLLS